MVVDRPFGQARGLGDAVDRRRLVAKARKAVDRDVHQVPPPIFSACGPFGSGHTERSVCCIDTFVKKLFG
jgi:hypothetical protein